MPPEPAPSVRASGAPPEPASSVPASEAAPQASAVAVVPNLDPAFVGTWESRFATEQGAWVWTWVIRPDGTYRFASKGPIALPEDAGTMAAGGGTFRRASQNGRVDTGAYTLEGGALVLKAADFTQTWQKARSPSQ